jgi:hypothetical protein
MVLNRDTKATFHGYVSVREVGTKLNHQYYRLREKTFSIKIVNLGGWYNDNDVDFVLCRYQVRISAETPPILWLGAHKK